MLCSLLSNFPQELSVKSKVCGGTNMGLVKAKIGLRPKALALCFLLLPLASPCWLLRLASSCLLLLPFSSRSSASASVSMLPACFSFSPCCSLSALAACILFSNALPLAVGRGPRILAPSCSPCLQVFSFFPFTEILLLALLLWRAPLGSLESADTMMVPWWLEFATTGGQTLQASCLKRWETGRTRRAVTGTVTFFLQVDDKQQWKK